MSRKILNSIVVMLIVGVVYTIPIKAQTQTSKQTDTTTVKTAKMQTIQLEVKGMSCQNGCADGLDAKFKKVNGISKSKTTFDESRSEITFDKSKISEKEIITIIEKRGFKARVLEAKEE